MGGDFDYRVLLYIGIAILYVIIRSKRKKRQDKTEEPGQQTQVPDLKKTDTFGDLYEKLAVVQEPYQQKENFTEMSAVDGYSVSRTEDFNINKEAVKSKISDKGNRKNPKKSKIKEVTLERSKDNTNPNKYNIPNDSKMSVQGIKLLLSNKKQIKNAFILGEILKRKY